ncbi:VOC family protein [Chryseosolibacter indicus]|uniref:VOC family protein n=1 Tax=Chryseosolibacter indicus TaxID=2782351 RepID=A0ABS5VYF2_9BACT|nr:VOC family protein [Chryseosolibacter indicus]MBT1706449.1 VOC family protein [Chryseosolibacter indicus]
MKYIILSVVLICMLIVPATAQKGQKGKDDPTIMLNHIAVHVSNLEQSTAFYENILGLKKIEEPFKDGLHTWFTLGAAGQLHLIQSPEKDPQVNKNNHICFSVKSVDKFIERLDANKIDYTNWPGTEKAPTVRVDGVKQIYIKDPNGHLIEINDDKPKK